MAFGCSDRGWSGLCARVIRLNIGRAAARTEVCRVTFLSSSSATRTEEESCLANVCSDDYSGDQLALQLVTSRAVI